MAVGTATLTFYQNENIAPRFTVTDPNVATVAGWTTSLVIKDTAADDDPPLHTAAGSVTGTLTIDVVTQLPITLAPGSYVYSLRRTNVGNDWQLAHGPLIVIDSAHKDVP
jgi:hypothetical protein